MTTKARIKCHFFTPVELMQVSLRRYKVRQNYPREIGDNECEKTGVGYCNAEVAVGVVPVDSEEPFGKGLMEHPDYPRSDNRWPTQCPCGYVFTEKDEWQVNINRLYTSPELPEPVTLANAPMGAMWDAWWYGMKGPDGMCLVVKTPGGEWMVDWQSGTKEGWTRTGTPPCITVTPSICIGMGPEGFKFHGHLRDGYLVEC